MPRYWASYCAAMGAGQVSGGLCEWLFPTTHGWFVYGSMALIVSIIISKCEWPESMRPQSGQR